MAVLKYISQALAIASTAYAACSVESATTLVNPQAVSTVGACSTFTGDIVVATGSAALQNTVDFPDLEEIDGKFTYESDNTLQTFQAPKLEKVGEFTLHNLSALATLDLSSLKEGTVFEFTDLSILSSLGLGGSFTKAESIKISNTQVADIKGIDTASDIQSLTIIDNPFLSQISLSLEDAATIDIGVNDPNKGQALSFNNLTSAKALIFRNASSVSLPALVNVSGSLELHTGLFQSFAAPKLTTAGSILINDNIAVNNISFPVLKSISTSVGFMQIANNTKLEKIEGFPALETVRQNVDLSGSFKEVNLPKLKTVGGAYTIDTSSKDFDCNKAKQGITVKGKTKCTFDDSTPTRGGNGEGGQSGGSSGGDSNDDGSAATSVNAPLALAVLSVFGTILSTIL